MDAGMQALLDWLVAIANDQIACIDDGDDSETSRSYVSRFQQEFSEMVSPQYAANGSAAVDALREGYIDLGTHCISVFSSLIFVVDFKTITAEFFTPAWYAQKRMSQIVSTFQDYLGDYEKILHPSLRDILIEEFGDQLLLCYLQSVRNKGSKLRRQDPFIEKIKDDVLTAFGWFEQFPNFQDIKQKWRVIDGFTQMLEGEKASLPAIYESFKMDYWDVGMPWVEAVLRARDDFDRSMLNAVKAKSAEVYVERGPDTIMSKVK
jgi:exocyst complex component 3